MSKDIIKSVLENQISRLTADANSIREGIKEVERKVSEMAASIQASHGALNYNGIVIESLHKQIAELDA